MLGRPTILDKVGQEPTVFVVGADGNCSHSFSLLYHIPFLSSSLWEAARCRLKYCLKELLTLKQQQQLRKLGLG